MPSFRAGLTETIPHLRRYARALVGDRDLADDLVQDCLARALDREHLWRGGSIRAWTFTILTNLNRNRLRAMSARPATEPLLDETHGDPGNDPLTGAAIERALALLPAEQREALLLVALEGFSYQEVAQIQDVPIGTVMSRLFRARTTLKGLLGEAERAPLRRVK